jgi:tetratricopeptide (TPR) repeat protein
MTIAGGILLAVLLVGVAGTTAGMLQANRAERDAVGQRDRAVSARDRTREVLDAMTSQATGDALETQVALSEEQKKFLTGVLGYYQEFAGEAGDDEQARKRTAAAAYRVGLIESRLGRNEEGAVAFRRARDDYAALSADFPAVPAYRAGLAASHSNTARLLAALGNRDEAEMEYRTALAIQAKLAAESPGVPDYRRDLANSHNNLGSLLAALGKFSETEREFRSATDLREKLAADFPAVPEYRSLLAASHVNLGNLLAALGKRPGAESEYRTALALQEKLVAECPAVPEYRNALAAGHNNLGFLLKEMGNRPESEAQCRSAIALREKLAADFPAVPDYRVDLAGSYCNFANVIADGHKFADSLEWYARAIATLDPIVAAEPRLVTARRFLSFAHEGRAESYDGLGRYAEAGADWDKAVALSPPAELGKFRAGRAASRLKAGRVAEAVAEVAELTKDADWDAGQWYDFACVYSLAAGKDAAKREGYAARAVELLRQAVAKGYADADHMAKDTDLDPIRGRDDFKKLLDGLRAKPPKPDK